MAYNSIQTNDMKSVLLSDTTKATFKNINDNSTELDNRADKADAMFEELYTEVGNINTALGNKQPLDADLTAIAGLTGTSGFLKKTAADTWTLDPTAYTTNTGTVTSVSAGTGLSISGDSAVNPTVNIADGYKLLTTSEYNTLDAGATAGSTAVQPGDVGTAAAKNYTTSVTSGSTDLVTSGAVYTAIENLPEPMIFKGIAQITKSGSTYTVAVDAPGDATKIVEGYTYKITVAPSGDANFKVGDTLIARQNNPGSDPQSHWALIPSGDDVEDTWRSIWVNGVTLQGNGLSSGDLDFKNGGHITVTGGDVTNGKSITFGVESGYSIPSTDNQTAWSNAATDISNKMDKADPTGTGSLSINRKANTTNGTDSVAVGYNCEASGAYSVAVGKQTKASSEGAYAEGISTVAFGKGAHAEGYSTTANGYYSHASGQGTSAKGRSQVVFGEYNTNEQVSDGSARSNYIEMVGNGTANNARSDARTLDWSGNEVLAGKVTATGFKTPSGTSSGFLKADGSVDATAYTTNVGTVTSVSAGTGLSIGGTASTTPVVNIASDYKLPTTTEYNALATQTYVNNAVAALAVTVEKTFQATDSGWGSQELAEGGWMLTLTGTDVAGKHPFACYKNETINNTTIKCEVMATLGYTSTSVVVIADKKFDGSVLLI